MGPVLLERGIEVLGDRPLCGLGSRSEGAGMVKLEWNYGLNFSWSVKEDHDIVTSPPLFGGDCPQEDPPPGGGGSGGGGEDDPTCYYCVDHYLWDWEIGEPEYLYSNCIPVEPQWCEGF